MRKGFAPLIILVIIALLAVGGFFYFKSLSSSIPSPEDKIMAQEYEKVEISQLIADPESWDGKLIQVSGGLKKNNRANIGILCAPKERGPNPEHRDEYRVANTTWTLADLENEVGIQFVNEYGSGTNLPDDYEGRSVTVNAIARYVEVPEVCDNNVLYKSILIEANATDVGHKETKPLPPTQPSN